MFSLKIEKGETPGTVHPLKDGENTLGRSRSATIRLAAADISGLHVRITVRGGSASLENLSQFGTLVDNQPAAGRVALSPGQRIALGKATVLLVMPSREPESAKPGVAPQDAVTGAALAPEGLSAGTVAATRPPDLSQQTGSLRKTAANALETRADSELTVGLPPQDGGETSEGMTRAMQTRAATPEEIEHLRQTEQKRHKRRIMNGLMILVPLLILAIIFRPRTPPPEAKIDWAKDANGDYLDLFEEGPDGGLAAGGYDLCYPGPERFKKTKTTDGLILNGMIGRDKNVPMRLIVQDERNTRFASMTRAAFVEEWMRQQREGGERWSFDKPSSAPGFVGIRNGLPYIRVPYYRDNNGSWFGVAAIIRHGYRRIVVRAEAPAAERVRTEGLLSSKFIRVAEAMEYAYWEPVEELPQLAEPVILKQVEGDLNRMAPATWVELRRTLDGLLTKAVQSGNQQAEIAGVRLLIRLHERQTLWFNSQQLAFDAARMQNNQEKAMEIARFTKAVFKDMEDQRYYTVRKWTSEL